MPQLASHTLAELHGDGFLVGVEIGDTVARRARTARSPVLGTAHFSLGFVGSPHHLLHGFGCCLVYHLVGLVSEQLLTLVLQLVQESLSLCHVGSAHCEAECREYDQSFCVHLLMNIKR